MTSGFVSTSSTNLGGRSLSLSKGRGVETWKGRRREERPGRGGADDARRGDACVAPTTETVHQDRYAAASLSAVRKSAPVAYESRTPCMIAGGRSSLRLVVRAVNSLSSCRRRSSGRCTRRGSGVPYRPAAGRAGHHRPPASQRSSTGGRSPLPRRTGQEGRPPGSHHDHPWTLVTRPAAP